jgi:hypothetical protein
MDDPSGSNKFIDGELRDIHNRIDVLRSTHETQYQTLLERLHSIEVRLAAGWRFPVAGWGAVVIIIGAIASTYVKVETGNANALKALELIEGHSKQTATNSWHRSEHDLYAQVMDARLREVDVRLKALEEKR